MRIGVYGPRAQRLLVQRHRIVIGVVVARRRSPGIRNGRRRRRSGADTGRTPARAPSAWPPPGSAALAAPAASARLPAARPAGRTHPAADAARRYVELRARPPRGFGCSTTRSTSAPRRRRRAVTSRIRMVVHLEREIGARGSTGRSAQSGQHGIWSSRRPKQDIARPVARHRVQRRTTAPRRAAPASRSRRDKVFVSRFQVLRRGQRLRPRVDAAVSTARTAISRVIVLHSAGARSRASVRASPRAGARRRRTGSAARRAAPDLAATLHGRDQRKLALDRLLRGVARGGRTPPGATGEGRTASSAASSQVPIGPCACESTAENRQTKNAPATSNDAVAAAASWRAGNNRAPVPGPNRALLPKALAESLAGSAQDPCKIRGLAKSTVVRSRRPRRRPAPLVPGKGRSVACGHRRRRGSTPRDAEASSRARRAITFTSGHRP